MRAARMCGEDYEYEWERKRRIIMQKRMDTMSIYIKALCIVSLVCIVLSVSMIMGIVYMWQHYQNKILKKEIELTTMQTEYDELSTWADSVAQNYNEVVYILEDLSEVAYTLETENEQLVQQLNTLQAQLVEYQEREELYDAYEWALFKENGSRTDITYKRITSLGELAEKQGLSDDIVNLVIALAMTESSGDQYATNSESTARGLAQMLEGTGRFVYERLMGNGKGTYNHDMAYNGDLSLTMALYYLDYLGIKYSDDIDLVIKGYRGMEDPDYNRKVNQYLAENEESLHSIALRP